MIRVGLHDAEKDHMKHKTFPNLALMKISAWHKEQGDAVEWWNPLYQYDRVYSSKVFDFTPENPYLPENAIRGGTGYVWIALCKEGKPKTCSVHRIVATAFIENPQKLPCVNHIDGNKTNNSVENLEWCTVAARNGLLARAKKVMCVETGIIYQSSGEAERATNICSRSIRRACAGEYKKAGGFTWKRV